LREWIGGHRSDASAFAPARSNKCGRNSSAKPSFNYIKQYRVNHLKVARSYIQEFAIDSDDVAAMRAILTFARNMGIAVIAQGVETEEQSTLLKRTDSATQAQGFHFSKAVGANSASELLRHGRITGESYIDVQTQESCI
jgi:predicted signal transduction protein with EAL and GGDEF domain